MVKPAKDRMRLRFEQAFPDRDEDDYWWFRYYMGIGEMILEHPNSPASASACSGRWRWTPSDFYFK
jgi:hypothetical protein